MENSSYCNACFLSQVDPLLSLDREKEFELIGKMTLKELTPRPKRSWKRNTPEKNGKPYHFPKYVYISDTVFTGYRDSGEGIVASGEVSLRLLL